MIIMEQILIKLLGALSLLTSSFNLSIGKFNSSLGPSSYSNLSLSKTTPPINQVRFRYNHKDKFTLLLL